MNKLKGYLGSLGMSNATTTTGQAPAAGKLDELGCEDALDAAQFSYFKASIFGFPAEPSCFAYDPVQRLFAIGTKTGRVRVFGQPGAECCLVHPSYGGGSEAGAASSSSAAILTAPNSSTSDMNASQQLQQSGAVPSVMPAPIVQVLFVINEGGLITLCSDYKIHYWDIREKQPSLRHSLQFQREIPSFCFHPVQSKWVFVGSSQGNVHFVNIESFTLSGYIIYWNKAVGPTMCSKHPGAVVQLIDSPIDPNKLLIGFESGLIVLWDLKSKTTECKFAVQEGLHSLAWHSDGRYFMSSHTDGSLITWDIKTPTKPAGVEQPHAMSKPGGREYFMPIPKVEWKTAPESEQIVLFSGGTAISRGCRSPSTLSIMRGKNLNLLDLQAEIIDFCTICSSPFAYEVQNPLAVAVLLENDLIIFDLQTPGYPPFENPYSMDIHDSEVTYNGFFVDVSPDIIPALYKAGMRQRQNAFSPKEWPVKGGTPGQSLGSYSQLIVTGHRNGIVKFWDASGVQLQILYLLNVSKLFQTSSDSRRSRLIRVNSNNRAVPTDPNHPNPEAQQNETPVEGFVEVTKEDAAAAAAVQPQNSLDQPSGGGLGALINAGTFAITQVKLSENGQLLLVGGVGFAILYRLNESQAETTLAVVEARFSVNQGSNQGSNTAQQMQQAQQQGGADGSQGDSAAQLTMSMRHSTSSATSSQPTGPQFSLMKHHGSADAQLLPPSSPSFRSKNDPNHASDSGPNSGGNNYNLNGSKHIGRTASCANPNLFARPPQARRATLLALPHQQSGGGSGSSDSHFSFGGFAALLTTPSQTASPCPSPVVSPRLSMRSLCFQNSVGCILKQGSRRWNAGYQPDLAVVLGWLSGGGSEAPLLAPAVTCLDLQQTSEVIFVGTSCGIIVVDCVQKACVMKLTTPETYACIDPTTLKTVLKRAIKDQRVAAETSDDETDQPLPGAKPGNQAPSASAAASSSLTSCNSQSVMLSPMSPTVPSNNFVNSNSTTTAAADINNPNTANTPNSSSNSIVPGTGGNLSSTPSSDPTAKQRKLGKGSSAFRAVFRFGSHKKHSQGDGSSNRDSASNFFVPLSSSVSTSDSSNPLLMVPSSLPPVSILASRNSFIGSESTLPESEGEYASEPDALEMPHGGVEKQLYRSSSFFPPSSHHSHGPRISEPNGGGLAGTLPILKIHDAPANEDSSAPQSPLSKRMSKTSSGGNLLLQVPRKESLTDSVSTGRESPDIEKANNQAPSVASADTITFALFAESYPNKVKPDSKQTTPLPTVPTLWFGTQGGAVFIAAISLPPEEERATSPVIVSISQTVYQLSGPVLTVAILPMSEFVSTRPHLNPPDPMPKLKTKQSAPSGGLPVYSGNTLPDAVTMQAMNAASQLGVMISRDQLVTVVLPAQTVASRARPSSLSEGEPRRLLVRGAVVRPKEHHAGHCVACLSADGQVSIFSLPRLRPLFEVDQCCDPVTPRSLNTFRFSHYGHAVFFDSPSEIVKLSFWAETNDKMERTQGSVFVEQPMPERPKQSFLKTLFTSAPAATAMAEREELFGDPNLKPSVNVARPVNRLQQMHAEISSANASANSPYGRMIEGAKERGEKLGDLDEKTQRMMLGAQDFAKNAAAMVDREKNKKWYNPFS